MNTKELLIHQFETDLKSSISTMQTIKYKPTVFLRMAHEYGYYSAAKKLVSQRKDTYGFIKLLLLGRTDLSIEALAVQTKYRELFTDEEIQICLERLQDNHN